MRDRLKIGDKVRDWSFLNSSGEHTGGYPKVCMNYFMGSNPHRILMGMPKRLTPPNQEKPISNMREVLRYPVGWLAFRIYLGSFKSTEEWPLPETVSSSTRFLPNTCTHGLAPKGKIEVIGKNK